MKVKIPREWVEDIRNGFDAFHFEATYSGRGMFGENCFGLVGTPVDLAKFLIDVLPPLYEGELDNDSDPRALIPQQWRNVLWDSFGTKFIFYWPEIYVE